MANEITINASLKYAKNGASASVAASFKADQTGDKYQAGVQAVGTSPEETLDKGDIGTIGYALVKNLDETNFVQLGSSSGVYSVKLRAGEGCLIPWSGTAVYAKADTAAVLVDYILIEA